MRLIAVCTVLCLAILVASQRVSAEQHVNAFAGYMHEVWQTKEGLPQNSVNCILQSSDGYIWFGTEEGLVRFDGVRFVVFDKRNTSALSVNVITTLFEARDSALWIGTDGGGVLRLKNGGFTAFGLAQGSMESGVRAIAQDAGGVLWFGTNSGIIRLKNGGVSAANKEVGLIFDWVNTLVVDHAGRLWIGTNGGGLVRYPAISGTVFSPLMELTGNVIAALHEDKAGNIWVGAEKGTLTRISANGIRTFALKGVRGTVSAILVDHEGAVWVGCEDGTFGKFVEPDSIAIFSRQGGAVSAIVEDREGSVWVGRIGGGLHRISKGKFMTYAEVDGLPSDYVQTVCPDPNGDVLVGTMAGVARFSKRAFIPQLSKDGMPIEGVTALHVGRDRTLWIGTSDGLARIKDGRFQHVPWSGSLAGLVVRGVDEDAQGNLWLATSRGLFISRTPAAISPIITPVGDTASGLRRPLWCVHAARNGKDIWVSTMSSGLMKVSLDGGGTHVTSYTMREGLSSNTVRSIYEDDEGTLWFGTYAGGLNRFRNGSFTVFRADKGLFDDNVFVILEDSEHNLWMSCNRGVFKVSKHLLDEVAEGRADSIVCNSYGTADGMRTFECNGGYQPSGCKASDGRLWFATLKGVAVVDPSHLELNRVPPPVVIESATFDKHPVNTHAYVNAPPGNGELQFMYTALSYIAPERVRFKYRLEGFDDEWIDAADRRMAYYTNISPGDYTFRVIAANNDGLWNDTGASLSFTLRPHFYQTTWFYAICVGLIALVGSAGYHFYRSYRDREQVAARLRAELAQAELQVLKMQLQPHFLFNTLHAISSLMHKDIDAADEMMARLGELLRYTLESIGSQEVELGQELEMLDHYLEIEHIRLSNRLTVRKSVQPELYSALVPNLILQPIVENAIRHGIAPRPSGGCIDLNVQRVGENLQIVVCDDGPGLADRSKEGVGFTNTRARLEQLYGTRHAFTYANRPEGGMCVTLEFPLRITRHVNHAIDAENGR